MRKDLARLAKTLHLIAHDAGYVLLYGNAPQCIHLYVAQFNRVYARIREQEQNLGAASSISPLSDDASAGDVRIAARALAVFIEEKLRKTHLARCATPTL